MLHTGPYRVNLIINTIHFVLFTLKIKCTCCTPTIFVFVFNKNSNKEVFIHWEFILCQFQIDLFQFICQDWGWADRSGDYPEIDQKLYMKLNCKVIRKDFNEKLKGESVLQPPDSIGWIHPSQPVRQHCCPSSEGFKGCHCEIHLQSSP